MTTQRNRPTGASEAARNPYASKQFNREFYSVGQDYPNPAGRAVLRLDISGCENMYGVVTHDGKREAIGLLDAHALSQFPAIQLVRLIVGHIKPVLLESAINELRGLGLRIQPESTDPQALQAWLDFLGHQPLATRGAGCERL